MIAIVNVGPYNDADPTGVRDYEVRINRDVVATFRHRRSDGLSVCLRHAAGAVERSRSGLLEDIPPEEGCTCADHQGGPCAFCMEAKYNL